MSIQSVGIPQAVDATERKITRRSIDDKPRTFIPPLHCGDCTAPVEAVKSHRRGESLVAAHFRLKSRTTHDHDDSCIYHFDARVADLINEIRHEVDVTGTTYRLLLREPDINASQNFEISSSSTYLRNRMNVVPPGTGWKIHPSLQSAMAIYRLLRKFDNDPAATTLFRAQFDGQAELTWGQFYFDLTSDTQKLWNSLAVDPVSPRAVTGTVRSISQSYINTSWVAELGKSQHDGITYELFLRSDIRNFLPSEGQKVMTYGRWTLGNPQEKHIIMDFWCDHPGTLLELRAEDA